MTTMTKEKFTAKDVQALRQRTGAGMMESKKALEENAGDMEKAVEYLRTKGIAKAEKRTGKQTSEGVIGSYIHHNGKVGVMVEINCETDFVARTDDFKQLVKYVAEHIAAAAPVAVDKDQVPADKVERERRIFVERVKESGKPDHLIEKIVPGKVEAYYKDVALVHQAWVREPKKTVGDLIRKLRPSSASTSRFAASCGSRWAKSSRSAFGEAQVPARSAQALRRSPRRRQARRVRL